MPCLPFAEPQIGRDLVPSDSVHDGGSDSVFESLLGFGLCDGGLLDMQQDFLFCSQAFGDTHILYCVTGVVSRVKNTPVTANKPG